MLEGEVWVLATSMLKKFRVYVPKADVLLPNVEDMENTRPNTVLKRSSENGYFIKMNVCNQRNKFI